jgi:hypothetical protein
MQTTLKKMEHLQAFKSKLQRQVGQSDNITFDFFIAFSRMEFALKHTTYAKADRNTNAMADWDRFANANDNAFQKKLADKKNKSLIEATNYLFDSPPNRLKYISNKLNWEKRDTIKSRTLKELLIVVRGVRNNLFHGSKRLAIIEQSRNRDLLNYGLIVLNECLTIDRNVRQKFLEEPG